MVETIPEEIVSESCDGDIEERLTRLEQRDQRLTRALELLGQRAAAPAEKAGRNWDTYAVAVASFIGLLALAVSGYTAYVQRQQLRAQVWPHVELLEMNNSNLLSFFATNQGTGPARVIAMRVTVGGVPIRTWSGVRKAAGFTDENLAWGDLRHAVLIPGKDFTIFQPGDDEQSRAKFRELLGGKHPLAMTICYCSVLDECWVSSSSIEEDSHARSPDACPITAAERFAE